MATLVLTAVGGAVGGPVGAMIGGLVGRAADGAILGGGRRREGPRLTELALQTSSYGQQVPRVWGRMRVAGTVFWATDLKEARSVSRGAKGQPATATYSYSASFAVLLAARRVRRLGRIWADGRLLRGAAGDVKVSLGGLRLHPGTEDQAPDPLIAAAEGVGRTPAQRGHAYAVFEDLALAEFGNRIPQMTFELIADEEPVSAGAVIEAVAPGADATVELMLDGFAATGGSARAVVELLMRAGGAWAAQSDGRLRLRDRAVVEAAEPLMLADEAVRGEGGASDDGPVRGFAPADTVPRAVGLLHYDPARDYQAGFQRVARPGAGWREERVELPAALAPAAAKAVAAGVLARAETGRVRRTVRTGAAGLTARPGDAARLNGEPGLWRVSGVAVERLVATVELVPLTAAAATGAAAGGRPTLLPDWAVGATRLVAAELPPGGDAPLAGPRLTVAASGGPGWRGAALLLSMDDGASWQDAGAIGAPSVTGGLFAPLPAGSPDLFDEAGGLLVRLDRDDAMLEEADDRALDAGANAALIGDELLQFGRAEPMGAGRWRLGRLLRGRRGTAALLHMPGARFVLLGENARNLDLPLSALGNRVRLMAQGPGDADGPATTEAVLTGASVLPPAPVHLRWEPAPDGGGTLRWVRRSRVGWSWVDGADAPLGEEHERYEVALAGGRGTGVVEVTEPRLALTAAQRVGGIASAEVRQRGVAGVGAAAALDF